MGTTRLNSSHSPFATEAAKGVRLLLFWPAELPYSGSAPGIPAMPVTALPSCCPFVRSCDRASGTKRPSGSLMSFPGGFGSVAENHVPKLVFFCLPCDWIVERTFPVSSICLVSWTGVHFPGLRLSWYAVPKVWSNLFGLQLRSLFLFHIIWAVFYRSPDRTNVH